MKYEHESEFGKIKIDEEVFGQIAHRAIESVSGSAWLATKKGKIIGETLFSSKNDYSQAVSCRQNQEKIDFNVYVIVRFGKSITVTSRRIIKSIKSDLATIGQVGKVKVSIVGILSKNVAKRKLEIIE